MANPPFNPNQALPEDTGVVSIYPTQERAFRDIVESWLLFEHGRSGHHAFPTGDQTARDSSTSWEVGSIFFNTSLHSLQLVKSIAPVVFENVGFPAGTRMLFQQVTAPLGWTIEAGAAFHDTAITGVTSGGGAPSGAGTSFSSVLAMRSIQTVNLPAINLDLSQVLTESVLIDATVTTGGTQAASGTANNFVLPPVGLTKTKRSAAVSGNLPLGGSGTQMDFNVKRVSVIFAQKD